MNSFMSDGPIVLVVDDEGIVLNVVSLVLRNAGFRVIVASGGVQALERVEDSEEGVSLAVLDMEMPGLNGLQLYERLQELYPQMRVLFISGHDFSLDDVPAGCDFLAKPFTASELLRRLRQTAERAGV